MLGIPSPGRLPDTASVPRFAQLGSFGAFARCPASGSPDTPGFPSLGLFGIFRPDAPGQRPELALFRRLVTCGHRLGTPNWVCLLFVQPAPCSGGPQGASRRKPAVNPQSAIRNPQSHNGFVWRSCPLVPRPLAPSLPMWPGIGFVLPMPVGCTIHHNSFPAKHLSLLFPPPKLGLFGAIALRPSPLWPRPTQPSRTPPRCPASGNWLFFASLRCMYE
jgi:hypothetical protein